MDNLFHIGIDIGSTTVKFVILDTNKNIIYSRYERHYSDIRKTVAKILDSYYDEFKFARVTVSITGSGGMAIASSLGIKFVQEVIAGTKAIEVFLPETDVAIELGGEDAKITYFQGGIEQRMNGTCAGGTGSFIDQMAALLQTDEKNKISFTISSELQQLIKGLINPKDEILVVGLGNLYSTPDSLGPKVIQSVDVTRHIFKYLPQYVNENDREVSAISPGVLGSTGIETQEILKGIVDNVKPKLIIAIDSLASKSVERISSSVQISDTGIIPGAGVGNKRKELSKETLGIPVIAIGIPTVLDFATIVSEGLDLFIEKLQDEAMSNEYLNQLHDKDNYEDVKNALNIGEYNMIVTPKEIDDLIDNMKDIVAKGINVAIN